jgi:hypothetical protein
MKASDLRIGNLIYLKGDKVIEVTSVDTMMVFYGERQEANIPQDAQPIPLTEEWLLKFGFQIKELANYVSIDFTTYEKGKLIINDANWIDYDDSRIDLGYNLKYVHQLQNLYHSLTGEELTIKP